MELAFHVGENGGYLKRKCPRGACDSCRQRKRKCHHEDDSPRSTKERKFIEYSPNTSRSQLSPHRGPGDESVSGDRRIHGLRSHTRSEPTRAQLSRRENSRTASDCPPSRRFIGDLNPVAFFVGDASARLIRGRACQSDAGVWLDKEGDIRIQDDGQRGQLLSDEGPHLHASHLHCNVRQNEALLPPRRCLEELVNIYFRRIHQVLPLIDENEFRAQFREQTTSPQLLQAICLAAAKDYSAEPFLCLASPTKTLPLRRFTKLLYDDLTRALAMKVEVRKITLIQVLALLSLHALGPEDSEESTLHLTQAAYHAQTLGIHLIKYQPDQGDKGHVVLFWCLWSLDRWSAAINGRPLVISDYDLGQRVGDVITFFEGPFRVWLHLASILGRVMTLYRPILDTPVDDNKPEIPRFEEVLDDCNGWDVPRDLMPSLELAYHAIALLAARPWGMKDQPRSHTLHLRQDLSVYRIATLAQLCDIQQFFPLPVVSYAMSLGFSISYKQLKRCQVPSAQHAAQQTIQLFFKSLKKLSMTWWSARLMTRLGQRALDRMTENDNRPRNPPNSPSSNIHLTTAPRVESSNNIVTGGFGGDLNSEDRRTETDLTAKEKAFPVNSTFPTINNQSTFDFTNVGDGNLTHPPADAMFEDIDDILGNFLNINIPNTSDNLLFDDFLMPGDKEGMDFPPFISD